MNILLIALAVIVAWVAICFLILRFMRFSGPDNDEIPDGYKLESKKLIDARMSE